MTERIILWTPHRCQRQVLDDKSRFKVVVCGRQFGKTTMAVNYLIEEALMTERGLFFYVAPTYRQAKMTAWRMIIEATFKLPSSLVVKRNEAELYVEFVNGAQIHLKGADNPDTLRGATLHGAVLDEYATMRSNVWTEIINPELVVHGGWCLFIGTPRGFNHFHKLWSDAQTTPDWRAFQFKSTDNPQIAPLEIETARRTLSENTFAQEYMADFRRFEGLVYKEFDRARHVVQSLPERQFIDVLVGQDFGFTNPAAILVIGKDFDNHYWVVDEFYKTGKTNPELIEVDKNFAQKWKVNRFYPDSAEPDRIEEMKRAGLNCREVNKEIGAGIDKVRELFKTGRIHILASCENTIWELETYRYPTKKLNSNEKEEPIKENDHAMDALRYAVFTDDPIDVREKDAEWGLYAKTNYA